MNFKILSIIACLATPLIGCGGSDLLGDSDAAVEPDLAGAKLQSGTYTASNIVKTTDACLLQIETVALSLPVANTGTMITIGNHYDSTTDPTFSPAGYGFGTGPYTSGTTATLQTDATLTYSDACTYTTSRTTKLTFVGNNNLAVDFTENDSNFAGCTNANDNTPDGMTSCTSHYTFNLTM